MYTTNPKSKTPTISMIAALAEKNNAIGKNNKLLWQIPEDLTRFKTITSGHPIIMGRKTYDSIGRPLPNRFNIVVSRNPHLVIPGCTVVTSLEEGLKKATEIDKTEIFIIGGAEIYKRGILVADRLYLTLVEGDFEGDAFFPDYTAFKTMIDEEKCSAKGYTYTFITLTR